MDTVCKLRTSNFQPLDKFWSEEIRSITFEFPQALPWILRNEYLVVTRIRAKRAMANIVFTISTFHPNSQVRFRYIKFVPTLGIRLLRRAEQNFFYNWAKFNRGLGLRIPERNQCNISCVSLCTCFLMEVYRLYKVFRHLSIYTSPKIIHKMSALCSLV